MRFVPNKKPMRRDFANHPHAKGLVAEADIKPLPRGRLAAKLLVFESQPALRAFWKKTTGFDISRRCPGVVNALAHEVIKVGRTDNEPDEHRLCGDQRYFCMIGLCLGEERIAYPSGAIAAGINDFLHRKKLYGRKAARRR
jgi:hypothetical protein